MVGIEDWTILCNTSGRDNIVPFLLKLLPMWKGQIRICVSRPNLLSEGMCTFSDSRVSYYVSEEWDMFSAREYGIKKCSTERILIVDDDVEFLTPFNISLLNGWLSNKYAYGYEKDRPTFTCCPVWRKEYLEISTQVPTRDRKYFKDGFEDWLILLALNYRWSSNFPLVHHTSAKKWYNQINLRAMYEDVSPYTKKLMENYFEYEKTTLHGKQISAQF
jgi:hypothetical protein